MWIAFTIVIIVVLGLAAYAATGKLGEMPATAVTDTPKGFVPDGPVDEASLQATIIPLRAHGYTEQEVDDYLTLAVRGEGVSPQDVRFKVKRRGYDMAVVDELLDRLAAQLEQESAAASRSAARAADPEPDDEAVPPDPLNRPRRA